MEWSLSTNKMNRHRLQYICLIGLVILSLGSSRLGAQAQPVSEAGDYTDRLPHIHSPVLDELANRPGRPLWAPLDVLGGHREVVPHLVEVLSASNATDRARAAFVLGQIGCSEAGEALWTATRHDNHRTVRLHAGIALAHTGDARGLHAAGAALTSGPPWVRFYAIMGLWRMREPQAWATLNRTQSTQSPFLATIIKGALQTPSTLPATTEPATSQPPLPVLTTTDIWEAVADAFVAEADWWWHKGDYNQAIRCLQVTVFLQPDLVDTYGDIAWLQWSLGYDTELGHDTEAIGTYHRAIQANPDNPATYFNLGFHYYNTHRCQIALPYLKQAVGLGGSPLMQRMYAHGLEKSGQIQASLKEWERMLQETPDHAAVRHNYERLREVAANRSQQ